MIKVTAKALSKAYLNSKWIPSILFILSLLTLYLFAINFPYNENLSVFSFIISVVLFFGIVFSAFFNLFKKRWTNGILNLIAIPISLCIALVVILHIAIGQMFGPSEDHFADNLSIPTDIELNTPLEKDYFNTKEGVNDGYQQALKKSLETPGGNSSVITTNIKNLESLHNKHPELLKRHLASSCAWRVFKEKGNIYATRRWMDGDQWNYSLHGYYSDTDFDNNENRFQSRFTIGLSKEPWAANRNITDVINPNETKMIKVELGNSIDSFCLIAGKNIVVEIFEQSSTKERRLTKAGLSFVQQELNPLVNNPSWNSIRKYLYDENMIENTPSFNLYGRGGIYNSEIWINPKEPGMLYLKAFEVTKGTQLSESRLKERSNEWVGWSKSGNQYFLSNTRFTIYEGDWDAFYAARFEVWFTPDSGEKDRKLMEKVFKIEGWQR